MKHVFEHDGQRFLYDLDQLSAKAYRRAMGVYLFQSQVLQNPPATWREFEASGAVDADERAFSYLLMELDEEGDPKPYKAAKSAEAASKFLEQLPSKYRNELEECRADFFDEAGLLNVVSLRQLGALYGASTNGAIVAQLLQQALRSPSTDETTSSDDSESSSNSTSPESSADDSTSAIPTAPTTTGPSDSLPEEPLGKSSESE